MLTQGKRTPGPWWADRGNAGADHPLFVHAPGKDGLRPWCDADAHLIAAAPALLEALKRAARSLRTLDLPGAYRTVALGIATDFDRIIAKAEASA